MNIEFITKQDLDDLENRLRKDIRKDINEDFEKKMRQILTEELPIILSQKFVTKDALREAAR
jgi:hypothetical protein